MLLIQYKKMMSSVINEATIVPHGQYKQKDNVIMLFIQYKKMMSSVITVATMCGLYKHILNSLVLVSLLSCDILLVGIYSYVSKAGFLGYCLRQVP